MNKAIREPWIKLKGGLCHEDYASIHELEMQCVKADQIALKLELDYKLSDAEQRNDQTGIRNMNEFLYFDGTLLIGYIGIGSFGGASAPLEITGMVHPDYRRQGIFAKLHELVLAECKRRNAEKLLALCDRKSVPGQKFLEYVGATYQFSEFEMYLHDEAFEMSENQFLGVSLKKATNEDAGEVARQNTIYFGDQPEKENEDDQETLLPEEEEKRGMTIYLAQEENRFVGKVHVQLINELGGIYGLGVLPEFRGKGFGRAVLLCAIQKLKEANAAEIMLQVAAENGTALNLYKSCGFQETSVMDYFELN
jgi:mycothiol synthase